MTVANTLAYYVMATITAVKSFIVQAPGPCVSYNTISINLDKRKNNKKCFRQNSSTELETSLTHRLSCGR